MKVIIFGTGDLANQLYHYLHTDSSYDVDSFCVSRAYYRQSEFLGKPVRIWEEAVEQLSRDEYRFILALGYKQLRARKAMFEEIRAHGFSLINFIHSTARVYGKVVGEGNIILANVTLEPFSTVDSNNIIWTNSLICHDSVIGAHNFIAAGSIIGGHAQVLSNNFIGFDATVIQHVKVSEEVLLGAKSLLLQQPESHSVYVGVPARKIKEHKNTGVCIDG
jgi:UDP-N-acetylbacillosamine N-acetyltransferase